MAVGILAVILDGWSGIPRLVVVVGIKDVDVDVASSEVPTGIGLRTFAVEGMMATPAMMRARKENCIFFAQKMMSGCLLVYRLNDQREL